MGYHKTALESFGLSDRGLIRSNNEDAWTELLVPSCFILADGMGGHLAGEVAADKTVSQLSESISNLFKCPEPFQIEKLISSLDDVIKQTNHSVHFLSKQTPSLKGMGTTLCLALLYERTLIYAHVGDSRIYRIHKEGIQRLTEDHVLRDSSRRNKNVITRAIGTHPTVSAEIQSLQIEFEEIYFLCSDGLTDALTDEEIFSIIQSASSVREAVICLIERAKIYGGNDNITIVMFKILNENLFR